MTIAAAATTTTLIDLIIHFFDFGLLLIPQSVFYCCDLNWFDDGSATSLRDDLLSDMWANLPAQVLPLRTMDAPV